MHQRKLDHTERAKRGEQGQFQEAIGTYGPEAFSWTQLDTANSSDELAKKEKEYVIQYDSKENGYNSDSGGGFKKKVYQYSIEGGSLVNQYGCLSSAASEVSANKKSISAACLGKSRSCKGFYWSYSFSDPYIWQDDKRSKKVIQLDFNGVVIGEFQSVMVASEDTGFNRSSIAKVCRGERRHAGGYKWSYSD